MNEGMIIYTLFVLMDFHNKESLIKGPQVGIYK